MSGRIFTKYKTLLFSTLYNLLSYCIFSSFFVIIIFCFHFICTKNKVNLLNVDVVYLCINEDSEKKISEGIESKLNEYNNEMLRYSIRSVLCNIAWINKIYIISSYEKISFLNDSEQRREKIMLINYQDILGFKTSSKKTLEYNILPNLDKYNVSEYFIYIDDNCFFNRRLKKNDFFYYSKKEKKVVPYVMNYKNWIYHHGYDYYYQYYKNNKGLLEKTYNNSNDDINIQNSGAFMLLYEYFNRTNIHVLMKEADSWNTALPLCLCDLLELYSFLKEKYEYKEELFNAELSNNKQIPFDICYSFYFLNKYNRERGSISEYSVNENNFCKYKKNMSDMFNFAKERGREYEKCSSLSISIFNSFFYPPSVYENDNIKEGIYYIRSEKKNKLVWTMEKKRNIELLYLRKFNGKDRQKFIIQKDMDNYYFLINKYYKKRIVGSKNTNYNTYTPNTNETKNRKMMEWIIFSDNEKKSFYFRTRKNDLYIDISNNKLLDIKKHLTMKYFTGSSSQRFFLEVIN